jgi:hypothetical protein
MKLWICGALLAGTLIGASVLALVGDPGAKADGCGGYECSAAP